MPSVSVTQLQQLQQKVAALSPSDSSTVQSTLGEVYGTLQNAGFAYAGWAKGVVDQNTIAGISAMQFLTGTALAGLDSNTCKFLTQPQIDQLKIDLADAYLRQLTRIADGSSSVDRDINGQEVLDIHQQGYQENDLPIASWTLDAVFKALLQKGGQEALEKYWAGLRDTEGDYFDATLFNIATWQFMKNQAETSPDPEIRELATEWLKHVPPHLVAEKVEDMLKQWFSFANITDPTLVIGATEAIGAELLMGGGLDIPISESIGDVPMGDIQDNAGDASTYPSPIILDLDGDGIETVSISSGTHFDHAADGFAERTGWVAPDDGLLVWDRNDNGAIDSGRELFGSETLLWNGAKAANGFEALINLDVNNDGVIDVSDPAYSELRVWNDTDGNGLSDTDELLTLTDAGVRSINTAYTNSGHIDAQSNAHKQIGTYTTSNGEAHVVTDVWFRTNATYSIPTDRVEVPEDIAHLPNMQGYGKVRNLQQAMTIDTSGQIRTLVNDFMLADTAEERKALVRQIIYRWTGVQNIDPTSRTNSGWGNAIGDARKLEALEEFLGAEWRQRTWGANPGRDAARTLNAAFGKLEALIYGQLMAQSHLRGLFLEIAYYWNEDSKSIVGDLAPVAEILAVKIQDNRDAGLEDLKDFLSSLKGMGLLSQMDLAAFQAALLPLDSDVALTMESALAGWSANDSA